MNESERFTQTTMNIHLLALLSESYIRKKNLQTCTQNLNMI